MSSAWEEFEKLVKEEMRKVYSEAAIEHGMNPKNLGEMEDADGYGQVTASCGDTMYMWLKVKDGTVGDISFLSDGCGTTLASGSMLTEMVKGKSLAEANNISQKDVLEALGGLPKESEHCALLAADTLKAAIKDYLKVQKEPWKKSYRKR